MARPTRHDNRTRVQVVTPRPSRRGGRGRGRKPVSVDFRKLLGIARVVLKPALAIAVLLLVLVGYNTLAGSSLFKVHRIEIEGPGPDLTKSVEQTVRRLVSEAHLLEVDLAAVRRKVEELPRVREAIVARALPDTIHVRVTERQPAVLVRRNSQAMVWLDADAVEVGGLNDFKLGQHAPPVARGFAEGTRSLGAISEDKERIALYEKLEQELGQGSPSLWDAVDEIDLSFVSNVSLRLIRPPVTVVVGGKDFRERLERARELLKAVGEGDAQSLRRYGVQDAEHVIENKDHINFIDMSRPDQAVFTFSTPARGRSQQATVPRREQAPLQERPRRVAQPPEKKV
jgi:hypothetical protein